MFKYSPSTLGFYRDDIHGSAIPEDAVEITDEHHQTLMDGQYQGKQIHPGQDGYPILIEPIPPAPLTAQDKLARAGLSVDELKELLGLPV